MEIYDYLIGPFADYAFMRRALAAVVILACGSTPLGVFLVLRRMSLMAEAMSHAVLPGVAIAFMVAGFSLPLMSLGGFCAGVAVALLAGLASRFTQMREDASFAALYPVALALGVMLVSLRGGAIDLMHLLFGSVLAVDQASLFLMTGITGATLMALAIAYRPLVMAICDPAFLSSQGGRTTLYHLLFLALTAMNLVAGFQAMGTLMAVGLMIIPAIAARFWVKHIDAMLGLAVLIGVSAGMAGLLISYHASVASGPAIILVAGVFYLASFLLGHHDSLRARYWPRRHLTQ
ncbi:MAG: metal ABC transporter permease [Alphaproteobacteria bacterium]